MSHLGVLPRSRLHPRHCLPTTTPSLEPIPSLRPSLALFPATPARQQPSRNARNINGVSFNGTANITLNAASSTLLTDNNSFTGNTTFSNASTTNISASGTGYFTTASTTNLTTNSLTNNSLTANTLLYANGSRQEVSASVASSLTFSAGSLHQYGEPQFLDRPPAVHQFHQHPRHDHHRLGHQLQRHLRFLHSPHCLWQRIPHGHAERCSLY